MTSEVSPASEWCQRWEHGTHTWRHRSDGGFDPNNYWIEPLDEAAAKAYVLAHHYSGSYPSARLRYGLYDQGSLVGVAVLGIPVSFPVLTNTFPGLEPFLESLELSRFVLADRVPANGESWFLGRVFREAAAVGLRGVVSFADPVPRTVRARVLFPGHVGLIYQATNARYTGRSTARTLTVLPNGEVLNERTKQKIRSQERGHEYAERLLVDAGARVPRAGQSPAEWLAQAIDDVGCLKLRHRGCHRYAFALGGRVERRRTLSSIPPSLPCSATLPNPRSPP